MMKIVIGVIAMIASARLVQAQLPADVQPGQRVRVWLPEQYRQMQGPWHRQLLRGTVAGVAGETLRLTVPGTDGTLSIARASMKRLEISRGRPNPIASMLERGIGGAIGGAISFAIANAIWSSNGFSTQYDSNGDAALAGAAWGGAVGGIIGLLIPNERWRRVRLSR
jgi:hypothetical protein